MPIYLKKLHRQSFKQLQLICNILNFGLNAKKVKNTDWHLDLIFTFIVRKSELNEVESIASIYSI